MLLFAPFMHASAQDSLASILAQAAKQDVVAMEYREIKHMLFLQEPVLASGRMFLAGESFVLEQLQPERLLMTTDKQRFRFFIPQKHVYHSKMLASPMVQKALQLFRPLMSGDQQALEKVFDTRFVTKNNGWALYLRPKDSKKTTFVSIRIEGKSSQAAHYAWVEMANGDTVEWFFSILPMSDQYAETMQKLLLESKG